MLELPFSDLAVPDILTLKQNLPSRLKATKSVDKFGRKDNKAG